ncbi:hypothetical protein AA0488_1035 [Kozakia baliensis NRIC 0488]|nr:hypothetical protein [Kozakia baliensis]GBR27062.1 hypothetical protein AA0488_1035 [Kozakia baliensis NRIC 0488]
MKNATLLALCFGYLGAAQAQPAPRHVIGTVNNYTCMMLQLTDAQRMDFNHPPQFKAAPTDDAADAGMMPNQVAVATGAEPQNGYVEAMNFAGRLVWVPTRLLAPYHAKADPTAQCRVVKYSDGKYGFRYDH